MSGKLKKFGFLGMASVVLLLGACDATEAIKSDNVVEIGKTQYDEKAL